MTRKLLVGAVAAGAFAITAGTAFALTGGDGPTPRAGTVAIASSTTETSTSTSSSGTPSGTATELTADDASRIVHARYGGTVREVERETEHGRAEWDVEIDAADGKHYEVRIDAQSGEITRVEQDDRDDDKHDGKDDDKDDDRDGDDD